MRLQPFCVDNHSIMIIRTYLDNLRQADNGVDFSDRALKYLPRIRKKGVEICAIFNINKK